MARSTATTSYYGPSTIVLAALIHNKGSFHGVDIITSDVKAQAPAAAWPRLIGSTIAIDKGGERCPQGRRAAAGREDGP